MLSDWCLMSILSDLRSRYCSFGKSYSHIAADVEWKHIGYFNFIAAALDCT